MGIGEGRQIDTRELSGKARRFLEAAGLAIALMAPGVAEAGHDRKDDGNSWAQLMGENVGERGEEIDKLERECSVLEASIARLEAKIEAGEARYARDPGLKFEEQSQLMEKRAELKRKQHAIASLKKGMEGATERENARRESLVDKKFLGIDLDPTLNLTAKALGNKKIADYYQQYAVGFQDHALYFNVDDGTADGARGMLPVGPEMESVQFYVQDGGRDLLVVFTVTDGSHKTLKLDDGNGVYYDSDERGAPKSRH